MTCLKPQDSANCLNSCYSSHEFKQFAESWGFRHVTSSPHYPQSNGLAEKTVQTAKRILTKAREDKKDPYLSLLEYRNTPVDVLKSPAQLLMSRRLRSILPTTALHLRPQVTPQEAVRARREKCQQRQQQHYNRSARPLSTLHAGTLVGGNHQQSSNPLRLHEATTSQPAMDRGTGATDGTFTTHTHTAHSSLRSATMIRSLDSGNQGNRNPTMGLYANQNTLNLVSARGMIESLSQGKSSTYK